MSEPRCETCRYWREHAMTCHRYPPENAGRDFPTYWPRTWMGDWCGEWVQREPDPWEREP